MRIHADVVMKTTPTPDPEEAAATAGDITENPAPTAGTDDSTELVSSNTTPRSGKKEKKP